MRKTHFFNIRGRGFLCLLMTAVLVAAALLHTGGCGEPDVGFDDPLLEGVVPSDMLAPYLESGYRHLDEPDQGDPGIQRDLETYNTLLQDLYDHSRRAAAVDSLFVLWSAEPDHVLWPELAAREARLLGAGDRRQEIFARPVCADTTTAIGAYMQGWRLNTMAAYKQHFRTALRRQSDLEPFAAMWIGLKAAFAERHDGYPERAVGIALDLLPRAHALGGWQLEALVWMEIARAKIAGGELDDALHAVFLADALATAGTLDERALVGVLLIREIKANLLAAQRNTTASLALYDANVAAAERLDLFFVATRNLSRAGILAAEMGQRELSFQYCRRSLDFALSDQDSLNVPGFLMNLARRFRMRGDLDSCLVYQERAEVWVAAYPHPRYVGRMPLMQAEYYAQVGQFAVVDSLLSVAAALAHSDDTIGAQTELHLELIRGWMESDRPDLVYRSIAALDDLRTSAGDINADRHVVADLNLLIGEFLTARGEYLRAAAALDRASAALERRKSPAREWTLARNRGRLARQRGNLGVASESFRKCITIGVERDVPEMESTGRFLLGSVLLADGRYAEARAAFPTTDAGSFVGRFTTRVSALLLTGISHDREGDHDLALKIFAEARAACRSWSPPDLIARIDLETGRALAGAGRNAAATDLYRDVAARLDAGSDATTPELAYFNGDLRRDLVEAVISLPVADPATTLRLARRVLPRWRTESSARDDDLASPQLIYFVGKNVSGRWLVTGSRTQWIPLPGEGALNDLLAPVLADMAAPDRTVVSADVRRLADALLPSVNDVWPTGATLAIVPDLALFGVPWAALPLADNRVLVDCGPLAILDKPTAAPERTRVHGPTGNLLVIGTDGTVGNAAVGLAKLRHAEAEARDLAAKWPDGRATLRLGPAAGQALSGNRNLATYEAIHVASHASVLEGVSDQTMLLLAGEDSETLTATAIRELDLKAELVFLSCCEAGVGRGTRSGYAGLARSFLDAGAQSVVAPLIVIDDEAARTLATRFYDHWLAGLPVPAALNAAQRDLRDGDDRWAHPFFWAFYQPIVAAP